MMEVLDGANEILKTTYTILIAVKSKKKMTKSIVDNCMFAIDIMREGLEKIHRYENKQNERIFRLFQVSRNGNT